jgi:hypothetical protein
MIAALTFTG